MICFTNKINKDQLPFNKQLKASKINVGPHRNGPIIIVVFHETFP